MNFELFQKIFPQYHAIMVLGKTLEKYGKPYHLIGMTRVNDTAELYVLNMCRPLDSYPTWQEQCELTMREKMESCGEAEDNYFMEIKAFLFDGEEYSVRSALSGCLNPANDVETLGLFTEMRKAGWRVPDDSVFYRRDWEEIGLTRLTIDLEGKGLPVLENKKITIVKRVIAKSVRIEQPVALFIENETGEADTVFRQKKEKKSGKSNTIIFKKEDDTETICYINRVYRIDVWKDQEERFADLEWNRRMREHMSAAELEEVKRQTYAAMEQQCPRGTYYIGVEYECSEDIGLQFYSKEYLDSVSEVHEGSAVSMMMLLRPEQEKGLHGLKLRGAVIQTPIDRNVTEIAAELYSYMATIPEQREEMTL